jgi:pyruvate dehydrogenase (quinone)
VAYPGRQVACFVGDGGLAMLMGDLVTLVKYRLPVKVIVIKNNSLGQIKWEQLAMEGHPEFGVELEPINFAGVARDCGMAGYTVEQPNEVPAVLREAFAYPGPAVVDQNEPPMPGKITTNQALAFAESLAKGTKDRWEIIKTVIENKIREVV